MVTNTPVVEFVKKENISWTRKIHAKLINSTALQPLNLKSSKIFAFTGCLNKRFKGYNLSSPVTRPFIRVITPFINCWFWCPLEKGSLKPVTYVHPGTRFQPSESYISRSGPPWALEESKSLYSHFLRFAKDARKIKYPKWWWKIVIYHGRIIR